MAYMQKRSQAQKQKREKPEYEQKLIDLRRVARVMAGGRRFSFRASLVIGNRKGDVGFASAKGVDTALAIEKAFKQARKHMMRVPLTKEGTIPHEVFAKHAGSQLLLKPARKGRGVMAGGARSAAKGCWGGGRIRPQLRDVLAKIPKKRGYRFKAFRIRPLVFNVALVERMFKQGETVSPQTLIAKGILSKKSRAGIKVKILATGSITKSVTIEGCEVSVSAKEKIEKAGGLVKEK